MTSTSPTGAEREPLLPWLGAAAVLFGAVAAVGFIGAGYETVDTQGDGVNWESVRNQAALGAGGLLAGGILEFLRRLLKS